MKNIIISFFSLFIFNKKSRRLFREKYHFLGLGKRLKINGRHNKIYIIINGSKHKLHKFEYIKGFDITVEGNDNVIEFNLPLPYLNDNVIHIKGDNNVFSLQSSYNRICYSRFYMLVPGCRRKIILGKNLSIGNAEFFMEDNDSTISVGDDCMFSNHIILRNSDGHAVIDENGKLLNKADHLKLGNNIWIGYGATILKNVQIGDNTVIGSNSLVCKSFPEGNCALGGNPAAVIKRGISWNRLSINEYLHRHEA